MSRPKRCPNTRVLKSLTKCANLLNLHGFTMVVDRTLPAAFDLSSFPEGEPHGKAETPDEEARQAKQAKQTEDPLLIDG